MPQVIDKADPRFVASLQTNISGIYFRQVAHYTPALIEHEFRKAVHDDVLLADEEFMHNLLFLVRKKELAALHDDVWQLVNARRVKPAAQVSALKTAYALGDAADRDKVDTIEAEALSELAQSGAAADPSPYVEAADRIGGRRSLTELKRLETDAVSRQRKAERESPDNHAFISQLDKTRARLRRQVTTLSRKQEILAKPETERAAELVRVYLRRPADLSCWAYREFVGGGSADAQAVVRKILATEISSFLPSSGQTPDARANSELDIRLRGTTLLQKIGATLQPDEEQIFRDHADTLQSRQPFFSPACDWEDVLDRR